LTEGEIKLWFGATVRDRRSGLTGRVIGVVIWDQAPTSLVVQPPVRPDSTVPPTAYISEPHAELIAPQPEVPIQ
jgi:hypothetical protein